MTDKSERPARVLVVDDNEDAATTLAYLLAAAGYEARACFGGWEALDVLLLGGLPIREPIAHYGPFVMNSRDEITQAIATTVGNIYTITFWLDSTSGFDTFRRLSIETGLGERIDLLVYTGEVSTLVAPEPAPVESISIVVTSS